MSESTDQTTTTDDATQADADQQGADGANEGGGNEQNEANLPDWAKKELNRARGEAAKYRVQSRESQEALKAAKTPEEFEAAVKAYEDKLRSLEREVDVTKIASKHQLPQELAEVLKGDTPQELEAHALKLKKVITVSEPKNLKGGLTPGAKADGDLDPRKLAGPRRR